MRIFFLVAWLALSTIGAEASTRSYSFPKSEGIVIGACLADGISCGKVAADAFCRKEGFAESILFAREAVTTARILDSGTMCEGGSCEAFKRIKCYQPKEEASSVVTSALSAFCEGHCTWTLIRRVGAILLEQNDDWAGHQCRYLNLETTAPAGR
jgi:hypothetical protein